MILEFPQKNNQPEPEEDVRTPLEVLDYIGDMIEDGTTEADQLIVGWVHHEGNQLQLRYMLGGEPNLTGAVGLLEMIKMDLVK